MSKNVKSNQLIHCAEIPMSALEYKKSNNLLKTNENDACFQYSECYVLGTVLPIRNDYLAFLNRNS